MQIAYHVAHEQFDPAALLHFAQLAEKAGFDAIHSSDHFHPWSIRQGQSGFSWSWLGAAMQATKLPFSMVCAPGQRYHPAIVSQAIATLALLFPGRFGVELGSGEALNECITGEGWPPKIDRQVRLLECVTIIRSLLKGEEISHNGMVKIRNAQLYTRPAEPPPLFGAAISLKTSAWVAPWSDGLLTILDGSIGQLQVKIDAYRACGGIGKPVYVQCFFSYHPDPEQALFAAFHQWSNNILNPEELAEISTPYAFDKAGLRITEEDIREKVRLFTSIEDLFKLVESVRQTGTDRMILHNVHRDQELFIRDFSNARTKEGIQNKGV